MDVFPLATRPQRTLRQPVSMVGRGLIHGQRVQLTLYPAPSDSGLVFARSDLPGVPMIPARACEVSSTPRRTILGRSPAQVELVEHLLAALAGMRIDNCRIELDAAEPPGLDGSARDFVAIIDSAGSETQPADRVIWTVRRPISLAEGRATITLFPAEHESTLRLSYLLDYGPFSPIHPQRYTQYLSPASFRSELAPCRTFLLRAEAEALQQQGVGRHLRQEDLLVFGDHGPMGNHLRFADEPARHKTLDMVGDLSLLGTDLAGHVVACRSGHSLNVALVRELLKQTGLEPLAA